MRPTRQKPYADRAQPVHRSCAWRASVTGLGLFVLAGCAAVPEAGGLRNPDTAFGISTRYDPVRFAGPWFVRGAYPLDAQIVAVERRADDWQVTDEAGRISLWPATGLQAGVDRVEGRILAVIWVDEGFRTAVVGDPEGRFAWILDREAAGGDDRILAARAILRFNGFDLSTFEMRR